MPAAGRRCPELMARLSELSNALTKLGAFANPYDQTFSGFELPKDDTPDQILQPFHDLDPSKIKLHGRGAWDATSFLDDDLCMAFRDPRVLICPSAEPEVVRIRDTPEVAAELARKWDQLDLLYVHDVPIHPLSLVRAFGAFKDSSTHRQIGDRRAQNSLECKVCGPSKELPAGADFSELFVDPSTSKVHISITDRKDFYHQFLVSDEKAKLNTIGPPVPRRLVEDTKGFQTFLTRSSRRKFDRLRQGDRLKGKSPSLLVAPPSDHVWLSFHSILQGDHTGVEIATQAHMNLLRSVGALDDASTMKANRPLQSGSLAEGLVIDDYFCVTVDDLHVQPSQSKAFDRYNVAQSAYEAHGLLGSPHKDLVCAEEGKVIGAYINGSSRARNLGLVTLGAPAQKRIALAYLTLLSCQMRHTSDSLHLCLIGGWVSVMGFRRPVMSVLQESFTVVSMPEYNRELPKVVPLPRKVADELTLLCALMPLMVTELNAPFHDRVYCTDASLDKGAVLEADISPKLSQVLWKASRSKGAYSRLLSPVEVVLKRLGALEESTPLRASSQPEKPIAFSFEFLEVFAGAAKISKAIEARGITPGPPLDIDVSPEFDLKLVRVIEWLTFLVAEQRLLGFFLGPPCTTFSIMRRPRLRDREKPFGFEPQEEGTQTGNVLAARSAQLMYVGAQNSSSGILETPYSSYMKHLPQWGIIRRLPETSETRCDSCRFGSPHLKSFRFLGLRVDLTRVSLRCQCRARHLLVEGKYTKDSATYTDQLACALANVLADAIWASKEAIRSVSEPSVKGLECQLTNEIMKTSNWKPVNVWSFRKRSHINLLEEASLLRLCQKLARHHSALRVVAMLDSNVCRCATAKGRSSSRGLSQVLRKVSAICFAAGLYLCVPFCPTRLNVADDPTRDQIVRAALPGLDLDAWDNEALFKLAALPKMKRWASNWTVLVLKVLGSRCLFLSDRSVFRRGALCNRAAQAMPFIKMEFDATLGFPGEGPMDFPPISWLSSFFKFAGFSSKPCRWTSHTGSPCLSLRPRLFCPASCGCLRVLLLSLFWVHFFAVPAMAMPIHAGTAGELRRAQIRGSRGPLALGRPVTQATTAARERYWDFFLSWLAEIGIECDRLLEFPQQSVEEINLVLTRFGRELYSSGKSYNQYAETINALSSRRPSIRRMLQQAWDLAYAWARNEPSHHHVAMPIPIIISMVTVALMWGWTRVAGCLALGYNALLRPGEITGALRRDLLLPSDLGGSIHYALLSIREPKSRFSYARHQTAKADSEDFLQVLELAFGSLADGERLWPFSPQTLRNRFRSLLNALQLPVDSEHGMRCLDLGSLRSGGATFIITMTENSELCRRRGRWASFKMMDIYIQETMALQYMRLIPVQTRDRILQVASSFSEVLLKAQALSKARIPLSSWFLLFSR